MTTTKQELLAMIRDLTIANRNLTETNRELLQQIVGRNQDQDQDQDQDQYQDEEDMIPEEPEPNITDELRQQVEEQAKEIEMLRQQIAAAKRQSKRAPKWKRPVDYAKRYLRNWQELFWNPDDINWIKAYWNADQEQFVVLSSYEEGSKYFADLKDVGTYFVEKNYIPKGYNVWREFKDVDGNDINRLDKPKSHKKRSDKRRA